MTPEEAIHWGRTVILQTFQPIEISPKTPMQGFRGRGRHQVAAGGYNAGKSVESGIQAAGLSPSRVHASETRKAQYSKPLPVEMNGDVRRAIAGLEPILQAWISHRYRRRGIEQRDASERFARLFWREVNYGLGNAKTPTRIKVHGMITLQVATTAASVAWMDWTRGSLLEAFDVSDRAWSRTYRAHWIAIGRRLAEIDRLAVEAVMDQLNSI